MQWDSTLRLGPGCKDGPVGLGMHWDSIKLL